MSGRAHVEMCLYKVEPTVVLCVDDDARALMVRSLLLSSAGYDVKAASSSDAALSIFGRLQTDLVIVDQFLPHTNGIALAAQIKALKPETLVVLLTSGTEFIAKPRLVDLILTKCIEPQQFLAAIEDLLASRPPRDPGIAGGAQ